MGEGIRRPVRTQMAGDRLPGPQGNMSWRVGLRPARTSCLSQGQEQTWGRGWGVGGGGGLEADPGKELAHDREGGNEMVISYCSNLFTCFFHAGHFTLASISPPPPRPTTSLPSLGPQSQPQACHLLASDLGKAPASSGPTCAEGLAALFMAF